MFAHTDAGGRDHEVGVLRRQESLAQVGRIVLGHAEIQRLGPGFADQGHERVGVRGSDLSPVANSIALVRVGDLVARAHERDHRPAVYWWLELRNRREHAELCRAQLSTCW